jgi:hypothetical protein
MEQVLNLPEGITVKPLSLREQKALRGLNKRGLTPQENREAKEMKKKTKDFAVEFGLDWGVLKTPAFINLKGDWIQTKDYALVHTKTNDVLNSVKEGYRVSQNLHIIRLMFMGIKGFGDKIRPVMAGSLNGGRRVYIQLEIIGDAFIGNDTVKRYVTIVDSNDGSSSLSVGIGDKTMSCSNQFFYFSKNGDVKFRHSASMAEKMKTIPSLITFALSQSMRMVELYKEFQSTPITRELAHDMVRSQLGYNLNSKTEDLNELSLRSLRNMNTLYENIYGEMDGDLKNGNEPKGENLWGLLSGVTRWTTHDKQAPKRDNGRLESIMIGTNYRSNTKALDFVLKQTGRDFAKM